MNRQIGELTTLVRTLTEKFPRLIEKRMATIHLAVDQRAVLTW